MNFKELPLSMKPREKALKQGLDNLSDIELLAVALRTGPRNSNVISLAEEVLNKIGSLNNLDSFSIEQLAEINGIGKIKALELKTIAILSKRINEASITDYEYISNPMSIFDLFHSKFKECKQEHFMIIVLNAKNAIIDYQTLFIGSLSQSIIHPREIFNYIIKHSASSFICLHNHPSGDPSPSNNDFEVTEHLAKIAGIFGIPLLDHIIIGEHTYYSFKENEHL